MKINGRLILFTLILVAITVGCKVAFGSDFDWSGFTPIFAIALFSGFIIRQRDISFLFPLVALFLSDLSIQILYSQGLFPYPGFYEGQWINYLILLSATLIGWGLRGNNYLKLGMGAIAAPTLFFLISNFQVFLGPQTSYPKNFSGLITCYEAGLPFYRNGLIATLVFLPGILLLYNYMMRKKLELKIA